MGERFIRNGPSDRRETERRIASIGYWGREGDTAEARRPKEKLKGDWLSGLFKLVVIAAILIAVDYKLFDSAYLGWIRDGLLAVAAHTRDWSDNLWK